MGSVTHVVAILELPEILPKMLPADVDVRPVDAALELRPEAFHRVDAGTERGRVFADLVVDLDVPVAATVNVPVAAELVGVDGRSGQDLLKDAALHRDLRAAIDHAGDKLPAALKHPNDA